MYADGRACCLQYGLLIQMMADAGYTVISTPFAVTFKHTDCAAAVHEVSLKPVLSHGT